MTKILKKLTALLLPALCLALLTACKSPTGPLNYNVAGTAADIPTITSVVGERSFVGSSVTRYAKAEEGNLSVTCAYSGSPDVSADIQQYCDALAANGFTLQIPFNGTKAVLTAPSTITGQHIQMTVTMTDSSSYTVMTEIMDDTDDASALPPEAVSAPSDDAAS